MTFVSSWGIFKGKTDLAATTFRENRHHHEHHFKIFSCINWCQVLIFWSLISIHENTYSRADKWRRIPLRQSAWRWWRDMKFWQCWENMKMMLSFCLSAFLCFCLWSNVWRVSSLESLSLCQNSKVAPTHWLSQSVTKVRYRAARAAKTQYFWVIFWIFLWTGKSDWANSFLNGLVPFSYKFW